jgi:hypothetical protein
MFCPSIHFEFDEMSDLLAKVHVCFRRLSRVMICHIVIDMNETHCDRSEYNRMHHVHIQKLDKLASFFASLKVNSHLKDHVVDLWRGFCTNRFYFQQCASCVNEFRHYRKQFKGRFFLKDDKVGIGNPYLILSFGIDGLSNNPVFQVCWIYSFSFRYDIW